MKPIDVDRIARIDYAMYRQRDADAPAWDELYEEGRERLREGVRSVLNATRAAGYAVYMPEPPRSSDTDG